MGETGRDEKQPTGGEKRDRGRYAGRRTWRWTAGDEDNVGQTKREGEMSVRSGSERSDGGRMKCSETQGDRG